MILPLVGYSPGANNEFDSVGLYNATSGQTINSNYTSGIHGFAVSGNTLYVGGGNFMSAIIDVYNTTQPNAQLTGSFAAPFGFNGSYVNGSVLAASGNNLYMETNISLQTGTSTLGVYNGTIRARP